MKKVPNQIAVSGLIYLSARSRPEKTTAVSTLFNFMASKAPRH